MNYKINLFGYDTECNLSLDSNQYLSIQISEESQNAIFNYLKRVIPRYTDLSAEDLQSSDALLKRALEIENRMGNKLTEPKVKLPYEVQPEVKNKLVELAAMKNTSATQLLMDLIQKKYQDTFN